MSRILQRVGLNKSRILQSVGVNKSRILECGSKQE